MPIPVTCRCGKSFAANDNLAGKTVKCPSCQQPLAIPATAQAAAAAPRPQSVTQPAPQRTADGKIVVACACGAKFAAGAELAGKRVKCPKCGQALTVGEQPAAAATPQAKAPAAPQAAPSAAASIPLAESVSPNFGGEYGLASLLDEAGVKERATGDNACPSCQAYMAPEAVLCINCGYDRKTGKKLTTATLKKVEVKKLGPPNAAAKAGGAKSKAPGGPINPYAPPNLSDYATTPTQPAADLTVMDYLFCIFCGWIALIVILIYIAQGNPKGKPMLIVWCIVQGIGFVIGIIFGVLGAMMEAGAM